MLGMYDVVWVLFSAVWVGKYHKILTSSFFASSFDVFAEYRGGLILSIRP